MEIHQFYAQSIGVRAPWKVTNVKINAEKNQVEVRVECKRTTNWVDPESKERAHVHGWVEREWRHLDTCEYETVIQAQVPRLKLKSGKTIQAVVPWAEPGGRFTKRMESRIIEAIESCKTTVGAARLMRVSSDQIDGVMKRAVQRGLMRRRPSFMTRVGLDEKALRKHHHYATILTDIDDSKIYEVVEGRTKTAATQLLTDLPEDIRESIEAVAMDMWKGYITAVQETLPNADIVFDKFHVAQHLHKALDRVRIQENRELRAEGNDILKGTKYFWFRTYADKRSKAAVEFRKYLNADLRTGVAWSLKESFKRFWDYKSWSAAIRFVDAWIGSIYDSGLKPLERVAQMVDEHIVGLLNHLIHPITNAAAEGLNASIQGLRTAARGLPKFETFRIRILFHLGKLQLQPAR